MAILEAILLAVSLCADCLAVSLCSGVTEQYSPTFSSTSGSSETQVTGYMELDGS